MRVLQTQLSQVQFRKVVSRRVLIYVGVVGGKLGKAGARLVENGCLKKRDKGRMKGEKEDRNKKETVKEKGKREWNFSMICPRVRYFAYIQHFLFQILDKS